MSFDAVFIKGLLEDLVVFNEFILIFAVPLDFAEPKRLGVERIKHSTVDSTCSTLLDLGESKLNDVKIVSEYLRQEVR